MTWARKREVVVLVADEVVDRDVAGLAVAVEAAVALLELRGVPRAVVVQQVARGPLEVEALGGGVGGDEDAHRVGGVVEGAA